MAHRRGNDAPAAYPADGGDGYSRGATPPNYSRDTSPRDKIGRYRGRGGGGDRPSAAGSGGGGGGGLHVNLNVEQMVSMVFELRGTIAHEVEARRSVEAQLHETRLSIESLREVSSRDNNKWTNLLGRVKELEVASKLDNRLVDLNSRADKFSRQADASKIVSVFEQMRARMDAAEREYRDTIARMVRDQQRDHARMDAEMRNFMEANMGKVEQRMANEIDSAARIASRVQQLEKEFAVFMNTQMQMQMNAANKEKDGDWLKIYLTENFNAQKAATEIKFAEVAAQLDRVQEQTRAVEDRITGDVAARISDVQESVAEERVSRDTAVKKLSKSLKLSFTNLGENLRTGVTGLDAKVEAAKRAQNEAISNLHGLVLSEQRKLDQHQAVFQDLMGVQAEHSGKEHHLRTRIDGLEEVLKAEIKSRIKNYQKHKLTSMEMEKNMQGKLSSLEGYFRATEEARAVEAERLRAEQAQLRAEEEEQARLLHMAMETRAVLDGLVSHVDEQSGLDARRHEWKAFGSVIELELRSRDEELERRLAAMGAGGEHDPASLRGEVASLRSFVEGAFAEHHAHAAAARADEEDAAQMLSIAMESRAVLDGLVGRIAEQEDRGEMMQLLGEVRALHGRQAELEGALRELHQSQSHQAEAASASAAQQAAQLAQGLSAQVDAHAAHLDELSKSSASQAKTLSLLRSAVDDSADQVASTGREVKGVKNAMLDVQDLLATQQSQVKTLQLALSDASAQVSHLRGEVEARLGSSARAQEASSSSSLRTEELAALLKRLETLERGQGELLQSAESLSSRQGKLDQSLLAAQSASDDHAVTMERRFREARERADAALEESEIAIKKVDKKLLAHLDEFDKLQAEVASTKSGAVAAAMAAASSAGAAGGGVGGGAAAKHVEEALADLRSRLSLLGELAPKLDSCRSDLRDLSSRTDACVPAERHARDIKDLLARLQAAEEAQAKDAKTVRASVEAAEEARARQHKAALERLAELEARVVQLRSAGAGAGSPDDALASKRVVDASLVEREVRGVAEEVSSLARRVKDQGNAHEDALNRVQQDLKRMRSEIDALEAASAAAPAAAAAAAKHGETGSSSPGVLSSAASDKAVSELSHRVGQLESELKLKSLSALPALTLQVETLQSRTETRLAEHADKFAAVDLRLDKQDADIRAAASAAEESDAKQNRRVKDLAAQVDAQSARDIEAQNQLKQAANARALEADEALKASEARSHAQLKELQRNLDQTELALKSHARAVDEKLHAMEWSLEYAKDEHFKKDAKQIRAGAEAPQPQRPQPQQEPQPKQAAAPHAAHEAAAAAADEPSENYAEDSRSKLDAADDAGDAKPHDA